MPTTRILIDRLHTDIQIRRICGWERKSGIPEEWTFYDFSKTYLLERIQESFISEQYQDEIVAHTFPEIQRLLMHEKTKKKSAPKQPVKNWGM